jgi:hypothetical protein
MTSLLAEVLQGEPLTERETEILAAAAEGETAAQTGARLYLSSRRSRVTASASSRSSARATARTRWCSPSGAGCCPLAASPRRAGPREGPGSRPPRLTI